MAWSSPHVFAYGEIPTSANLNANFALLSEMAAAKFSADKGGFLVSTGISNTGAVVDSRLTPSYWVPRLNRTLPVPVEYAQARTILSYAEVPVTVGNTSAETNLWSYSMPGGVLSAKGALMFEMFVVYSNTSGSNKDLTTKFYLGATAAAIVNTIASGTTSAARLVGTISSLNATNSQMIYLARGNIDTYAAATIDVTSTQTVKLTVTHSAAASTVTITGYSPTLYLVPAVSL